MGWFLWGFMVAPAYDGSKSSQWLSCAIHVLASVQSLLARFFEHSPWLCDCEHHFADKGIKHRDEITDLKAQHEAEPGFQWSGYSHCDLLSFARLFKFSDPLLRGFGQECLSSTVICLSQIQASHHLSFLNWTLTSVAQKGKVIVEKQKIKSIPSPCITYKLRSWILSFQGLRF